MIAALYVVTAGVGTLIRWQTWANTPVRPVATLVVNITGAFLLGMMANASADSQLIGGVAGLGAMTTFSTLIGEIIELHERGNPAVARIYAAGSIVGGVGAAWLGLQLA